jgi:sulfite reductase (ferredoxin)
VACRGALTCNLGLCNSPALSKELEELIKTEFIGKKVFTKLAIKFNACPNSCGHQPVGKISFHGMVRRVDNRPVPFYKLLLGGRKEVGKTKLAEEVGVIPAKNIPGFLRAFLNRTEQTLGDQEDIYEFLEKKGKSLAREIMEAYIYVPSYSENRNFYIDWGRKEEFSLAGLGPGECGAGVLDMIESDLTEAKLALAEAEKNYSAVDIKKALFLSARALLVVKGSDPKSEAEAFLDFKNKFIGAGIASDKYAGINEIFAGIADSLSREEKKEKFLYAKEFLEHINQLYKCMDSAFNFPGERPVGLKKEERPRQILDLKGTPCPLNYVKAKLFLEELNSGAVLEIFLDEGEPMDNVPRSLEADGHKILKLEKQDGFYRLLVKKA